MTGFESSSRNSTELPLYYAGGYGYDHSRNRTVANYLNRSYGFNMVAPLEDTVPGSANPNFVITRNGHTTVETRWQALSSIMHDRVDSSVSLYQKQRAVELLIALEEQGHGKVDAFYHSADALNGVLAAHMNPAIFRNVVLAYPAGLHRRFRPSPATMDDETSTPRTWHFPRQKYHHTTHFERPGQISERFQTLMGMASYTIGASALLSYQVPVLSEMSRQDDAPNVLLVVGAHDLIMPPERIIRDLGSASDVYQILVTDTPHGIKGRKETIRQIVALLPQLERARAIRESGADVPPLVDRMQFAPTVSLHVKNRLRAAATGLRAAPRP